VTLKQYVRLLDEYGPMTTRQLAQRAGAKVSTVAVGIANARKMGLIEPVGEAPCPGRNKPVIVWGARK
jgi:predicted transcriptional regulator